MTPTPEQEAILDATTKSDDSLMISAYAGCGKTSTLVMVSKALKQAPSLALAFNVKIKKELEQRFPGHFTVMTMNGLGHRAWARVVRGSITLDDKKLGKIVTEELKTAGMKDVDSDYWVGVRSLVSKAMQAGMTPKDTRDGWVVDSEQAWKSIAEDNWLEIDDAGIEVARRSLRRNVMLAHEGVISFDDQIYMPIFFGGQFPRFGNVLVDEAQDLSPLNHEQVARVAGETGRLTVCGDPKQAIYAFRGADSESMEKLRRLRSNWIDLPLATTFRCPKAIVARQQSHAPGFRAFETAPEGEFKRLERQMETGESEWTVGDLPQSRDLVILCRNNAPLLSIAFKLIRNGIGVQMLGRDIGQGLISLSKKLAKEDQIGVEELRTRIENWRTTERSKAVANDDEGKIAGVEDRAECLIAVIEGAAVKTAGELRVQLTKLFNESTGRVTLATGHRAKGLEWDSVVHLDPWRVPSKYALKNPKQLGQEMNLKYVIETRSKRLLMEANLEHFNAD